MSDDAENAAAPGLIWVLTDGKIGDDVQCLAVARALGGALEKKVVAPRAPWAWAAPWGPADPRDAPDRRQSPIAPPFPDVVLASGRRAIPYACAVKDRTGAFTVVLKDPRAARKRADLIWAPAHDRLSGENVFSTLTSPHALGEEFAKRRREPGQPIAGLPKPVLGVVLGGPGRGARFDAAVAAALAAKINAARKRYASIALVPSRRTPAAFIDRLEAQLTGENVFVWRGEAPNPYVDVLANAGALIVTADSHNMMSEAVATGTGVYAFRPPGLARKLGWFVDELERLERVRSFDGDAAPFAAAPIDATDEIVAEIRRRLAPFGEEGRG